MSLQLARLGLRGVVLLAVLGLGSSFARAVPLDPLSFTSLGSLNVTSGSITFNTDTLAVTGAASFTGTTIDQGPILQNGVADWSRTIAVFDFNDFNIASGVTVTVTGSRPLALLSRGNLTLGAAINLNGGMGQTTAGGTGGGGGGGAGGLATGAPLPGAGPGGGSAAGGGSPSGGSGGAFGGNGGAGITNSPAGVSYGDLLVRLQAGSGAGGASPSGGGGGGGGALELGAVGTLTVNSAISSNGGSGGLVGSSNGGSGAGGGLLLHAATVSLNTAASAQGGSLPANSGGGGGGRIAVATGTATAAQIQSILISSVSGGTSGSAQPGRAGVIVIRPQLTLVPSGQALNLSGITTGQTGRTDPRTELLVGNLTIDAGGTATITSTSAIDANAVVTVNGTLLVGEFTPDIASLNGSGAVQIESAGALTVGSTNADSFFSGTLSGGTLTKNGSGILTLSGSALVNAPLTINGGALEVVGTATRVASLINTPGGEVRIGSGQRLRVSVGSADNSGRIETIGTAVSLAEIEFDGSLTNAASTGLITGRDAIMRFNGGLTNAGSLAVTTGQSEIFGDIDNSGSVVVSAGSSATFYDDMVQNGTFRVSKVGSTTSVAVVFGAFSGSGGSTGGGDIFFEGDLRPGNSPATVAFDNNVGFGSGATLDIELGGATPGTQYDQVHVTGELALGGTLKIDLIDLGAGLFTPNSGDSFDILDWGSLVGAFSAIQLPTLAGALAWNTSQLYTTGVLSVVAPGVPGDYNNNGAVDAADYVLWRNGGPLQNDATPGVQPGDYDVWRAHFGQTAGSGSNVAGVPEPATLVLLVLGILTIFSRQRAAA